MRYKILFISSWFPNKLELTNGNFVQRHAEAVSILHDVEVLHAIGDFDQKEKFLLEEDVINGIRTLVVYYKNSKNPVQNFLRRMSAYKKGFAELTRPDLVHANIMHNNMLFAVWLKKKMGIPYLVTEHWTALRKINHRKISVRQKITAKIIGNNAEIILPVSADLKKGIAQLGITTPMKVVPNVVDTDVFYPKSSSENEVVFVHVSSLIERKNPEKIIETAINLLKRGYQFKLKIGGSNNGEIQNKLRLQINESGFGKEIELFGEESTENIAEKMREADCFILFSSDENQPCVIAESFASGAQVISTNVGGVAEFFPQDFGILIDKVDVDLLESAMLQILYRKSPVNKKDLNNYAQKTFSKPAIASQLDAVYQQILKK